MPLCNCLRLATLGAGLMLSMSVSGTEAQSSRPPAPLMRTDAIARVARLRTNSVVSVHSVTQDSLTPDRLFMFPREEALGSGVVIDANGLILTNAHVVNGADLIHVSTADGDESPAMVIGTDVDVDLALLLAADTRGLSPAPLGDSDSLQVGDWVVAIGNPLGLHHTVTAGIVSAKARTLDDSGLEYLQTDAAISPGSSGGPLLDLSGEVIGINVGILSTAGQNIGLNVAIPIAIVKEVLPRLRSGEAIHGWIGVTAVALSARGGTARGRPAGLVLTGITEDGPANRAGLIAGDVVLGFADAPSLTLQEFYSHIRSLAPGVVVRLNVWRNEERLVVPVTIGRRSR